MERWFSGRYCSPLPFAVVFATLVALSALFVWTDAFDRFAAFVQTRQVWELEEVLAALGVLGAVYLLVCFWRSVELRNKEMPSRKEYVKDIASELGREKGDFAVFVVEMGDGVDEAKLHQVEEVLADIIGEDRFTSFRVR